MGSRRKDGLGNMVYAMLAKVEMLHQAHESWRRDTERSE